MNNKKISKTYMILAIIIMAVFILFPINPVKADNITYTTIGGTWEQESENTWTMDKDGDGTADIVLVKNGDQWKYYFTVQDVDAEYYGWEEEPQNDYVIDGQGARNDPIIFQKNGTIKNKLIKTAEIASGGLTLTKKIQSESEEPDGQSFKFTITLSSDNTDIQALLEGTAEFGDITFKDGVGITYLKDNETISLSGIPEGTNFSIEEAPDENYDISWSEGNTNEDNTKYTGVIISTSTPEIICTNTKIKQEVAQPPEVSTLKISKKVVNKYGDDTFNFHIAFWNLIPDQEYLTDTGIQFCADSEGIADITFSLMDTESITFNDIPVGCQYQILEEANAYISSYSINNTVSVTQQNGSNQIENKNLSTAKETVEKDEAAEVVFTNTGEIPEPVEETLNIHVKKVWDDNGDSSKIRPSDITVYLMQDDEDIIASARLNPDNNWAADFTNIPKYKDGGTIEYNYNIQEVKVPGYNTEIITSQDENEVTYTITNTVVSVGSLKVSKSVTGNGADVNKKFEFKIKLTKDSTPISGLYQFDSSLGTKTGSINFDENGEASFTLKDQESLVIKNIPSGAEYEITESQYKDYTPSDGGVYFGTISTEHMSDIQITNTCIKPETHNITVTKSVSGNQGDKTKQFHFILYIEDAEIPGTVHYVKGDDEGDLPIDENGNVSFTLADKETIEFYSIISGTKYEVTETDGESDGYTVTSDGASGILNSDADVLFVNTKNVGIPTGGMTNTLVLLIIGTAGLSILLVIVYNRRKR